jgi:DNA-binding PucR family transcriptional regulator
MEQASGSLSQTALARMTETLPWFPALPPEHRAAVGLVAQVGVTSFVEWARRPEAFRELSGGPFRAAPRDLVRAVSLQQVVELVRIAVEVVEDAVPELAGPGDEQSVRELVLRYSREIAFAAAGVYANAAEERGAWDARLEALVVDAVVRGDADDALLSRAAALGWGSPTRVTVVAGSPPDDDPEAIVDDAHRVATTAGLDVLAGVSSERLVVVVGLDGPPHKAALALLPAFGEGPVVVGHTAPDLKSAGSSARAALAAAAAVAGWPQAPRPVDAADLLPERALNGDADARAALVEVYRMLVEESSALVDTISTYLEVGGSLEATGRALFLHPNTVRYRLRKVTDLCSLDPTHSRDGFALRVALTVGRLTDL